MSSVAPQRAFPDTQLNYLDGKLIRGFETNHPKMVDANLQLTHQLILNEDCVQRRDTFQITIL